MNDVLDEESEISKADPRLSIFYRVVSLLKEHADKVSIANKDHERMRRLDRQLDATLRPKNTSEDALHLNVILNEEGDSRIFDIRLHQGNPWEHGRGYRLEVITTIENGEVQLNDDLAETTLPPKKVLDLITGADVEIPYWAEKLPGQKFTRLSSQLNTVALLTD